MSHQFVKFGIDGSTHRIIIRLSGNIPVSGRPSDNQKPVNYLLGNTFYYLSLLHTRKSCP